VDKKDITNTEKVLVLIPPPVPPGEAPINIRTIVKNIEDINNEDVGMVLKPAVLGATDWKYEFKILSPNENFPIVSGFPDSKAKIMTVPKIINIPVVLKTIFVCNEKFLHFFPWINSLRTTYPRPPIIIRRLITRMTDQL